MNQTELNRLSHRLLQKPCRYKQTDSHAEKQGVILGFAEAQRMILVQDSYTGETFNVPARLVHEVSLFGPEDMPAEKYLRGYFS